jgi:histidyl-tRNA synthetase
MLTGVANDNDLAAIRMSLHMKTHHDKENKVIVSRMKQEICQKFGDRGKNISNLCTAGYFESFVIPLLQECRSNTALNDDVFKSYFNIIIEESAFSIFVNSRMSQDDVVTKIKEQIEKNTKYGIHYLVIHGIGETNVKNISHALADLENEKVIAIKTLDRSKSNIIRASCEYGKKILTTES